MIGQRFPKADEPICFITAILGAPGFSCKGLAGAPEARQTGREKGERHFATATQGGAALDLGDYQVVLRGLQFDSLPLAREMKRRVGPALRRTFRAHEEGEVS